MKQTTVSRSGSAWRWILLVGVSMLILGGAVAYVMFPAVTPPPALSGIDQATMNAQRALAVAEQASREALMVRQNLAREVQARNESIRKEVSTFDADRIARELNEFCYGER